MDAIQAAVLRVKLAHIESWNESRRRHAAAYDYLFAEAGLLSVDATAPVRALTRHALTPVVYAVEYPRAVFLCCMIFMTAMVLLRQVWTGRMKRKSTAG